jgi:tetratricopeptide (TPR) repeat protein
MKSKYVLLASALVISMSTFAQKDQIKAAEKALKGGNSAEAVTILSQAESTIAGATDAEKAQYYFVKGNAMLDLAGKKIDPKKNYAAAGKAYLDAIAAEKTSGKLKYTEDAQTAMAKVKDGLVNAARAEADKKEYKSAADLLYQVYDLDKTNNEFLYLAATYYMNAQDYNASLGYFKELQKLNYSGELTNYYAKSAVTDQEEFYGSDANAKKNRDDKVRLKLATTPRDEKMPSKKAEIAKYIALMYVQQGKLDEAKAAITEAKLTNPDDAVLLSSEADIYYKAGDLVTYRKLISQLIEKNPNDSNLYMNLGIATSKTDPVAAEGYYKKAIELKPDFAGTYINMALLKLADEKKLNDEINKLGTSEKDNKRYEVLKKQKDTMYRSAIPYLEKAYELKPDDEDIATTLMNVYGALEMMDKKKAIKAKLAK